MKSNFDNQYKSVVNEEIHEEGILDRAKSKVAGVRGGLGADLSLNPVKSFRNIKKQAGDAKFTKRINLFVDRVSKEIGKFAKIATQDPELKSELDKYQTLLTNLRSAAANEGAPQQAAATQPQATNQQQTRPMSGMNIQQQPAPTQSKSNIPMDANGVAKPGTKVKWQGKNGPATGVTTGRPVADGRTQVKVDGAGPAAIETSKLTLDAVASLQLNSRSHKQDMNALLESYNQVRNRRKQ